MNTFNCQISLVEKILCDISSFLTVSVAQTSCYEDCDVKDSVLSWNISLLSLQASNSIYNPSQNIHFSHIQFRPHLLSEIFFSQKCWAEAKIEQDRLTLSKSV